jgi:hypothetical protein
MVDMIWIRDIHGVATIEVITEFLKLWDVIVEVALELGTPNVHMRHSFKDRCGSVYGSEFGEAGHQAGAISSCG